MDFTLLSPTLSHTSPSLYLSTSHSLTHAHIHSLTHSLPLPLCLSLCLPVCLSVCLSNCLSVCLSLSLSLSNSISFSLYCDLKKIRYEKDQGERLLVQFYTMQLGTWWNRIEKCSERCPCTQLVRCHIGFVVGCLWEVMDSCFTQHPSSITSNNTTLQDIVPIVQIMFP